MNINYCFQVRGTLERHMERGLQNYGRKGFRGVTETWNVVQHEVRCRHNAKRAMLKRKLPNCFELMNWNLFLFNASRLKLFLPFSIAQMLRRPRVPGLGEHDLRRRRRLRPRLLLPLRHRGLREGHPQDGRGTGTKHPQSRELIEILGFFFSAFL